MTEPHSQSVQEPRPTHTCDKHGSHTHTLTSTIPGYEGVWCIVCALDLIGEPMKEIKT